MKYLVKSVRAHGILFKFLMAVALTFHIVSVFLPWISESRHIMTIPESPRRWENLFWSYKAQFRGYGGMRGAYYVLFFQDYWFDFESLYSGWFGIFVFQVLTIFLGIIGITKLKIRREKLFRIGVPILSFMAPLLCLYQRFNQLEWDWCRAASVKLVDGFWIAVFSATLFSILYIVEKIVEVKE